MGLSVLIVDDDERFRNIVELRLAAWRPGSTFRHAKNLGIARNYLDDRAAAYDLVILDQHLPDGLGADLFHHPRLQEATVLAVSADLAPEVPGQAVLAGAAHFLSKPQVAEPLFLILVEALLARKKLERELLGARLKQSRLETIRRMLATLRHEINNPLGAVLGGAYLLRTAGTLDREQTEALRLIEASGNRIKHVIQQLCEAAELQEVQKGQEELFQVPGDKLWNENPKPGTPPKDGETS